MPKTKSTKLARQNKHKKIKLFEWIKIFIRLSESAFCAMLIA